MILDSEIIKQVLSGKRSMVRLPVKEGEKVCSYKPGKAYVVKTSQKAPASLHITITDVRQELHDDKPVWVLRFQKGDHTDSDRLPAAKCGAPHGDYVGNSARALRGTGPEVSEDLQKRYAAKSHETYAEVLIERKQSLGAVLHEMRSNGSSNRELREVQRRTRQNGWPVLYVQGDSRTD